MSALGHKRTLPPHFRMSAFPPKADITDVSSTCPLIANTGLMGLQQICLLDLVGNREQRRRYEEISHARGLHIDYQFELVRLHAVDFVRTVGEAQSTRSLKYRRDFR